MKTLLLCLALLISTSVKAQMTLDAVAKAVQESLARVTTAEVYYSYDGHLQEPEASGGSAPGLDRFTGRWLYDHGNELVEFRPDPAALADLAERHQTGTFAQDYPEIYYFDQNRNLTLVYKPEGAVAFIRVGRRLRGWPPSGFVEHLPLLMGRSLADLLRGNDTAKLVSAPDDARQPVVVSFRDPKNSWLEFTVSLAPAQGFRPVRVQIWAEQQRWTKVYEIRLALIDDVWFPIRVDYQHKNKDGTVRNRVAWRCFWCTLNRDSADASRETVRLRRGTRVTDEATGRSVGLDADTDVEALWKQLGR